MERYRDSCHGDPKNFTGQAGQDKINVLKREFTAQQATLQWYCKTDNDIIRTSDEISKLIAMKLKLHIEGEFLIECVVTAAKSVVLNRWTIADKFGSSHTQSNLSPENKWIKLSFIFCRAEKTLNHVVMMFLVAVWHYILSKFSLKLFCPLHPPTYFGLAPSSIASTSLVINFT